MDKNVKIINFFQTMSNEHLLRSHLLNKHHFLDHLIPASTSFSANKKIKNQIIKKPKLTNHADFLFPCEFCSKGYNDNEKLVRHLALKHFYDKLLEKNGDDESCSICSKTFKNKDYLPLHLAWTHKALANLMEEK